MQNRKLWILLGTVVALSFTALGGFGVQLKNSLPPIPATVIAADGRVLADRDAIQRGQNVWQSLGGQEVGSVWGHGAYVAPDWTADWLHREAMFQLDRWAGGSYAAAAPEQQAALRERLTRAMRTNTYDAGKDAIVLSNERADAFAANAAHFAAVFKEGRAEYAIPQGALTDAAKAKDLGAFFWWTA